uniref:Ribosomal protein L6 n=1 Tax=Phaeophyceae sp. TaxID=2249243 RepID=A0A8E8U508_9PHAE|nr:ribosomal protein L6 [Phaeophyceae sp.]
MMPTTYRLPVGIECLTGSGKVSVIGSRGSVVFNSVTRIWRRGDILIFYPPLTSYYRSIFNQAVLGVLLGYTLNLRLVGIGYNVKEVEGCLRFSLGYSRPVVLEIPEDVFATIDRKKLSLESVNFRVLQNFATTIRSYRFPDSYKGGGIVYAEEVLRRKEGKKT